MDDLFIVSSGPLSYFSLGISVHVYKQELQLLLYLIITEYGMSSSKTIKIVFFD